MMLHETYFYNSPPPYTVVNKHIIKEQQQQYDKNERFSVFRKRNKCKMQQLDEQLNYYWRRLLHALHPNQIFLSLLLLSMSSVLKSPSRKRKIQDSATAAACCFTSTIPIKFLLSCSRRCQTSSNLPITSWGQGHLWIITKGLKWVIRECCCWTVESTKSMRYIHHTPITFLLSLALVDVKPLNILKSPHHVRTWGQVWIITLKD